MMIPRLSAITLALCLISTFPAGAQTPAEAPANSSPPGAQSAQVPSSDKAKPAEDQSRAAGEMPVLNPPEAPQDQKPGGNRADGSDGVGANKGEHESYERTIANFTIALAIATIALVMATGALWWETRKLATQAVEASKDTKRSIEIAEESAEAAVRAANTAVESLGTERAWMIFQGFNPIASHDAIVDGTHYVRAVGIQLLFNNSGRTPALKTRVHTRIQIYEVNEPIPRFDLPQAFFEATHAVTGPTHTMSAAPCGVGDVHLDRLYRGEIKIALYAAVEYQTIFSDDLKRTEICGDLMPSGHVRREDGENWWNLGFQLNGEQNTVS